MYYNFFNGLLEYLLQLSSEKNKILISDDVRKNEKKYSIQGEPRIRVDFC